MMTDRMNKQCELIGIPLLDNIIVGGDNRAFFSFKEKGKMCIRDSQYIGRKKNDDAGESASQLLSFSTIFTILIAVIVLLGKDVYKRQAQELNVKVSLSGLSKQDYIIQCLLKHEIRVVVGIEVYKRQPYPWRTCNKGEISASACIKRKSVFIKTNGRVS